MYIICENCVITVDWGQLFWGGSIVFSYNISGSTWKYIVDDGTMYMQILPFNDIDRLWFWFIGIDMVESATATKNDWQSAV